MAEQNYNAASLEEQNENSTFSIHDIIQMVIVNWYWFVISVLLCVTCAYLYVASTPKVYVRSATVLVKDSRKGGDIEMSAFTDLAGFQTRRNVDNELYILQSHRLMQEVVKKLDLGLNYSVKRRLRTVDLYDRTPVQANFINDNKEQSFRFAVTILPQNKIQLSHFSDSYISEAEQKRVITAEFGDTIASPIGQMVIEPTVYMSPEYQGKQINVSRSSLLTTTNAYRNAVNSSVANKQVSVITLSLHNSVPKRAEDVLNTLIEEYNADAIRDKRRVSEVTGAFIKERLEIIGQELSAVDQNIESFKQDNQMYDLLSEAQRNLSESSKYKNDGLVVDNQIRMAQFIKDYLMDGSKTTELIPATAAVASTSIATLISNYNTAILRREKLTSNSSGNNPVILELDNELASVRRSIIASLDSHISTLEIQREALRKEEERANRKISSSPSQEKKILGITRQQKIKEELYLYLLNKQEENELNYAITESNSRVIDSAYGPLAPVSPKPFMVLLVAIVIGLAIPFLIIYIVESLDTTIRGRRDVEGKLSVPFLGDIPLYSGSTRNGIVVRKTGRDSVSEAFRILRSNMTFMNVGSKEKMQVVMITSSNPHSGKTFVASNLAMTLAMADKKVLLIDLDLRRHTLSEQMGHSRDTLGVTGYLAGTTDLRSIIMKGEENLDMIYAGIQPPNPAEMLLSEKLDAMIQELRKMYDFIIIDSTPAMNVADAIITDRLVDLCIYIVREGILDRRQLPDIERLYREKKFHNMSIVLNGSHSHHGYGYGYGYSYGYGYGYGYGYEESHHRQENLLKRIRKILSK